MPLSPLTASRLGRARDGTPACACLNPQSYAAAQALAERLLESGALGVVYPSVRHEGGTCLACFRPALVTNVRRDATYRFTFSGARAVTVSTV